MAVKIYSKKKDGNNKLSANFSVREFACNDGSDEVKIDLALVTLLQKIRDHFKKPVKINSAYRTPSHNKKIGGSPNSQHMLGKAADIKIVGVEPIDVARYAELIGAKGVGVYPTFTHIDTRQLKTCWKNDGKSNNGVSSFLPALKKGDKGEGVKELQLLLKAKGFSCGSTDGVFGERTELAVKAFQNTHKIEVDAVVGQVTWSKLLA